jgi:large subunit ribosomal protein L30
MAEAKTIAVVRVRGVTGVSPAVRETLLLLGLTRVNHCVVGRRTPEFAGMVERVKDYVTWGEIDAPTLAAVIEKSGRLEGDKKLTAAFLKAKGFDSFQALADKVLAGGATLPSVEGLKKVFRLHPPRKGYTSVKRKFPYGALGNRGAEINGLIKRMI